VQEYVARKIKYPLQKDANLIKQKYMTQETAIQNIKNQLKSSTKNEKMEGHKRNPMHGQFYQDHERPSEDKEKSLAKLSSSGLTGEMDSLIIAVQDLALTMHYHQRNIMWQPTDSKRRMCHKADEHIKHIAAGCKTH
jgi:hypothetical protein